MTLPYEFYVSKLRKINGINFSNREIEIITLITHGKSTKKIGAFLKISPKTVANHIHNITQKLNCSSRDRIIEFVESSKEASLVKKHYINLLKSTLFEDKLSEISAKKDISPEIYPKHLLLYIAEEEQTNFFISQIEKHFNKIGVKPSITSIKKDENLDLSIPDLYENNYVIVIDPSSKNGEIFNFKNKNKFSEEKIALVNFLKRRKSSKNGEDNSHEKKLTTILDFEKDYYSSFFEILTYILPKHNIKSISANFNSYFKSFSNEFSKSKKSLNIKKIKLFGICALIICTALVLYRCQSTTVIDHPLSEQKIQVKSSLFTTEKNYLIIRSELLDTIKSNLNKQNEAIKIIALTGIGGAGKTTLARYYASEQKAKIVWEINAETEEHLINSFKDLAYMLAQHKEAREKLDFIQNIKNSQEREKQIIFFVRDELKKNQDWMLIFDNIESLEKIKKYLPRDPQIWGTGKIIITTRNDNIRNTSFMKPENVIYISELTAKEALILFSKILYNCDPEKISEEKKKEISEFLLNFPLFPLDIATAAYYIKNTKISFQDYIIRIKDANNNFNNSQESILKETTDYTKTRYAIITLVLKKIIDEQPNYKALLWFISLLDSQEIPIELLKNYQSSVVIEDFLYTLRKYSLITNESSQGISLHRSTQEICFTYLINQYSKDSDFQFLDKIVKSFDSFLDQNIEKLKNSLSLTDNIKLNHLISHCNSVINKSEKIKSTQIKSILLSLGRIYYYLSEYKEAKIILEKFLSSNTDKKEKIALATSYLGFISKELGDYKNAQILLEKSLTSYKNLSSKKNDNIHQILNNLSNIYKEFGRYDKVKEVLLESIKKSKDDSGLETIDSANPLVFLGDIHRVLGEYHEAQILTKKGVDIYKKLLGDTNVKTAWASLYLASIYLDSGKYIDAEKIGEAALEIYRGFYPSDNIELAWGLVYLGRIYNQIGEYQKAKEALLQAYSINKSYSGEDNLRTAWAATHLADVYNSLGEYLKAKLILEKYYDLHKKHFGEKHIRFGWFSIIMGNTYKNLKMFREATECLRKSLSIYENHYGKDHLETAIIFYHLGEIYFLENNIEEAKILLRKSLKIFMKDKHPRVKLPQTILDKIN